MKTKLYFAIDTESATTKDLLIKYRAYNWTYCNIQDEKQYGITTDLGTLVSEITSCMKNKPSAKRDTDVFLFAHNGSKWDFFFVLDYLKRNGYTEINEHPINEQKIVAKMLELDLWALKLHTEKGWDINKCNEYADERKRNIEIRDTNKVKAYEFSMIFANGKLINIIANINGWRVHFIDSNLKIIGSIKSFGEDLNKEFNTTSFSKLEMGYAKTENEIIEEQKAIDTGDYFFGAYSQITVNSIEYAIRDSVILAKYLQWFYKDNMDNITTLTRGSETLTDEDLADYTKRKNDRKSIYHNGRTYDICANSIRGGYTSFNPDIYNKEQYCEVFRLFDINSAHPTQMVKKLPVGEGLTELEWKKLNNHKKGWRINEDYAILYMITLTDVRIKYTCSKLPVIPQHPYTARTGLNAENAVTQLSALALCLNDNQTCYSRGWEGNRTYVVWNEEYKFWTQKYDIGSVKVLQKYYFKLEHTCMKKYVEKMYDRKRACKISGDKVGEKTAKLGINSLYGKTEEKCLRSSKHTTDILADRKQEVNRMKDGFYLYEDFEVWDELKSSVPSIGSFITMKTRMMLLDFAYLNYDFVLYTDTDSVMLCMKRSDVVVWGNHVLDTGSHNLGEWDLEKEVYDCYFKTIGCKQYMIYKKGTSIILQNGKISTPCEVFKYAASGWNVIKDKNNVWEHDVEYYKPSMIIHNTKAKILFNGLPMIVLRDFEVCKEKETKDLWLSPQFVDDAMNAWLASNTSD